MSRYLRVSPHSITPLHPIRADRSHHLRELVARMRVDGWEGRPILVERTSADRYQAWTATHRLAAARRVGMLTVPVVVIDRDKYIRRWGDTGRLLVEDVDDDMDKYAALLQAGDFMAARVMHQEIEMNLGADAQRCGSGPYAHRCL